MTGEIAEDLTYYFATSEQVASSASDPGVLMNHDNTVRQAGGFIIQLLPGAAEEVISTAWKNRLPEMTSVTSPCWMPAIHPEDDLSSSMLGEFGLEIHRKDRRHSFACNCSRERIEKALISIGRERPAGDDQWTARPIEMNCHFCNKHYPVTVEELKKILAQAKKR